MARLKGVYEDVMHEEAAHYVADSLFHIRFLRDLLRRTGPEELERAENIGWIHGNEYWYGMPLFEIESDHLNRILAILDLPAENASVGEGYGVQEGEEVLDPLYGAEEAPEAGEEDLLITLQGKQEDLDRLAGVLMDLDPSLVFCKRAPAEPPKTLAETYSREEAEKEKVHVTVVVKWGVQEAFELYHGRGFFNLLISAWEVIHGKSHQD